MWRDKLLVLAARLTSTGLVGGVWDHRRFGRVEKCILIRVLHAAQTRNCKLVASVPHKTAIQRVHLLDHVTRQ